MTVTGTNPWEVLGLSPEADAESLKQAFRHLARQWHPDLNGNDPDAEERFKRINEAYAVLSDPRRRLAWERGTSSSAAGGIQGFPAFEDYLEHLFGAGRHSAASHRGVSHGRGREEAVSPGSADDRSADSDNLHWPPSDSGTARRRDPAPGSVTPRPATPAPVPGRTDQETVVDLTPEQALAGDCVILQLEDGREVEVWTPPFAGDGWRLRLAGVAPGAGDHFVQLRVRTEEGLRIDGLRVLFCLDLSPSQAVLGSQAIVPTLDGPVRLRVPAGSSSGRLLRLRGRGLTDGERRGDQIVELRIVVPADPTPAEQALYGRLMELEAPSN